MVRTKKQRAKALEKGIISIEKQLEIHEKKIEQAIHEKKQEWESYTRKEIKKLEGVKGKKEEQLRKLRK